MAPPVDTLDDYQVEGARWLAAMRRALLADVMGIGKSAQAVEACRLVQARTIIVACQGGKRSDWLRDFPKWWPNCPPLVAIESALDAPRPGHVNVCSYDMIDVVVQYMALMDYRADVLIIDEVQFLKSPTAQRTKRVLAKGGLVHYAEQIWLLSGTPFLNHPAEMWPWLYVLFPEVIDHMDYDAFVDRYCIAKTTRWGDRTIVGVKKDRVADLRRRLWPIMLRRGDEAVDLPPLLPFEDLVVNAPLPIELAALEAGEGGKAVREALAKLDVGRDFNIDDVENNEYVATLRRVTGLAKTPAVCRTLIAEAPAKLGVLALHRDVIDLAAAHFADAGFNPVVAHGGVSTRLRDARKATFVNDPACRVWIGQLDAVGTGTDGLQHAAHDVALLESSWVSLNNLQGIKRFHRRGQRHAVRTRFASLAESLDQHLQRTQRRKTQLFASVFG